MPARILAYSATAGYRHDSIEPSIEALKAKASSINVEFDGLTHWDFAVLDETGKAALQKYLNLGGNFIGIHCAADALRDTPFFGKQIGKLVNVPSGHPRIGKAPVSIVGEGISMKLKQVVEIIDDTHPSTKNLPARWKLLDEMYNFQSDPRLVGAKVLITADESSYSDPQERKFDHGKPHPISWYQERGAGVESGGIAGRSWYTGLGHCIEIWSDEIFLSHILGGITWTIDSKTTRAFNSNGKVGNAP